MKSKVHFFLLFVFLIFTKHAIGQLPQIKVHDNKFVNEEGKVVIFRGVNTSDPGKLDKDGHWNRAYFEEIKAWGANIVRLPIHPIRWRSYGEKEYLKLLDQGVEWATELGLYLIMDWHSIGNLRSELFFLDMYDTDLKETYQFWRIMAEHYKDNTTVAFFELYNEPTVYNGKLGTCTWEQWKEIMEELIVIIRGNGSEAIPLVTGFNWGYDLTEIRENPIEANGIAYVSHPYPQKREKPWEEKWTDDWGFAAKKYPLILTEVGFSGPEERGAHTPVISDESYGDALVKYCEERGISFVIWSFDPDWPPTMIKDWDYRPTRQGKYFKKVLQDYQKDQ